MNPPKQLSNKNDEDSDRSAGSPRSEAPRKSPPKPAKTKKADSTKKTPKKPDEGTAFQWWNQFRQYLREVVYEMRKVVWPSRKETLGSTAVVLVIVILAGTFLGIVDVILSRLVRLVVG